MKKLTFLLAFVFAVSMAMGQTAVINQTSNTLSTQTADVSQTGDNLTKVTQLSEKVDHPAGTSDVGFDQEAKAKQWGGNDNKIVIFQSATGKINGGAYKNTTYAEQNGKENDLKQTQISAEYTSGGMDFSAKQKGVNNKAEQYSKKTEADFILTQDGKLNQAYQKTTGEKTGVLDAFIKQVGDMNKATQLFHGTNVRWAGASIDQNGKRNEAKQEFDNNTTLWNDPSKADIIQRDNDNYAYQKQLGQGSYQYIKQSGNNNDARMWSVGDFNNAYAKQAGSNGVIKIHQTTTASTAVDGNSVMISQDGNLSKADIMQDGLRNSVEGLGGAGTYAINNNGAFLKVSQTGMDNTVQSRQLVPGSETVTQVGMNNLAIVNQY